MSKVSPPTKNKVKENIASQDNKIGPGVVGYKLIWMIRQTLAEREMTLGMLAEQSGVSQATLSHVLTGRRSTTGLERDTIEALSKWLGIPVMAAMFLSEQVKPEDFYSGTLTELNISRAVKYILSDPEWGAYAPSNILDEENPELQLFLIWCYEQATQTKLISGSVDFMGLIQDMESFRSKHKLETARIG